MYAIAQLRNYRSMVTMAPCEAPRRFVPIRGESLFKLLAFQALMWTLCKRLYTPGTLAHFSALVFGRWGSACAMIQRTALQQACKARNNVLPADSVGSSSVVAGPQTKGRSSCEASE